MQALARRAGGQGPARLSGSICAGSRLTRRRLLPGLQGSLKPALLKVVKEGGEGVATIVYTTFQFQADDVANYLYTHGLSAASYHAGKFDKVTLFACTCTP